MKTKKQKLFAALVVLLVVGFAFAGVVTRQQAEPVKDDAKPGGYRELMGRERAGDMEILTPTGWQPQRQIARSQRFSDPIRELELHSLPANTQLDHPVRQWEREKTAEYKQWLIDEGWVNADGSQKYVPGEVVVQFTNDVRSEVQPDFSEATPVFGIPSVDAINAQHNAQSLERVIKPEAIPLGDEQLILKHGLDLIYVITFDEDANVEDIANAYLDDPAVHEASPNWMSYPCNIPQKPEPNDAYWDSTSWPWQDMKILEAWYYQTGNPAVEVCHIALGPDASTGSSPQVAHADLDLNYSGTFGGTPNTPTNHPTQCLACMSAENNNNAYQNGVAGGWFTTPGCEYTYYGMLNSVAGQIAAFTWVGLRGCIVANVSFGGDYPGAGIEAAINAAWDAGCIITASAGNEWYPHISYPAYFGNVMAISATQHGTDGYGDEQIWVHGHWVEACAPGGNWAIDLASIDGKMVWGTSFSSPKAAGVIGLMQSQNPGWTAVQLRAYLSETSDWIDYIGDNADRSGLMGGGRVNAYEAMYVHDKNVSLNRIWSPVDKWYDDSTIVYEGRYIEPAVVVQNRGINRESFFVMFQIDSVGGSTVYADTVFVEGLADRTSRENKGVVVEFEPWYAGIVDPDTVKYLFTAYTTLTGDMNAINDTVSDTVWVSPSPAGGVIDTIFYHSADNTYYTNNDVWWVVQFTPAQACSVIGIQFRTYDNPDDVYYLNPSAPTDTSYFCYLYADNSGDPGTILRGPDTLPYDGRNTDVQVNWSTPAYVTGDFHAGYRCWGPPHTLAQGSAGTGRSQYSFDGTNWNDYASDEWAISAVVKYPGATTQNDMATWTIIRPDAHELDEQPLIPIAVVKNVGVIAQSNFPVTMKIDSAGTEKYSNTQTVTATLNQYDVDTVVFSAWTPLGETDVTYDCRVYTGLSGDEDNSNDTLYLSTVVNNIDTIMYDDDNSRWYFGSADTTELFSVTFTPTRPCSVIGMDYELYVFSIPAHEETSYTACSLYAWYYVENDTSFTDSLLFTQPDERPVRYWNTYDFTGGQKFDRPNAEAFGLGYWVHGENAQDSVYPLCDDQGGASWHSYFKSPPTYSQWTLVSDAYSGAENLMIRARVRYTQGAFNHDVAALTIDTPLPYAVVYPNRAITPQATLINYGQNSETFNVIFTIKDTLASTEYADTQNVTVPVAETYQVSFDDWSPQVVDMDYTMIVETKLGTDQNAANNQITSMVFCRTINVISYNEQPLGYGSYGPAGLLDSFPYSAVMFEPERPCTVWGVLVQLYSSAVSATNPCSVFMWEDTLDHPAMTTVDYDTFTMAGLGADSAGFVWQVRIDFDTLGGTNRPTADDDFWLGVFTDVLVGTDTVQIPYSDFASGNIDGHSLSDTVGRPNDQWFNFTWVSGSDTTQADLQIKALVKYLEYPSDAPLAPDIRVSKAGNNARIHWNPVTTDVSGNPTECDHYTLYEDATYNFTPGDDYFLAGTPDTFYNHTNALITSVHNYLGYSFNKYGTKSNITSNMGFVLSKFFNENPAKTDRNWVALPYHNDYANVAALVADLSPTGNPLTTVTNLRDDQLFESYLWNAIFNMWLGTNFAIVPGQAYEMVTTVDTFLVIVGSNEPDGLVNLNWNPATTDRNWVAIPYNAVYSTVSDITTEYAPTGNPLTTVTNLRDDQLFESYLWNAIFNMWLGTDFAIVPGRGYEMVTITDTTWNPTEYSNEAAKAMIARRGAAPTTAEVVLGTAAETERAPAFAVEQDAGVGLSAASAVVQSTGKDMPSISHTVRVHVELDECEGLVLTAYRPDAPHDVLTEEIVGSGVAYKDDLGAVWFDAGNFDTPWQPGEEVMLIIEATKDGRGYVAVLSVELDETVDVQDLETVSLTAIPEPVVENGVACWNELEHENIIGYSLYDNDTRINSEMITAAGYAVAGEVSLKLVFTGGYETVSGSQGFEDARPRTFAFSIRPNPFAERATISYALPRAQNVSIEVYDVTGRQVTTLASGSHEPGFYQVTWTGDDAVGRQAATGVYFVKMISDDYQSQHKVIFVR